MSNRPGNDSGDAPRIAVVGCGAIAEQFYLPALARHAAVRERVVLVDSNTARLRAMAEKFGMRHMLRSHTRALREQAVDGVIVATPHHLHYPIAMDYLKQGVHVLCEKPLTIVPQEARDMVAQASASGVTLSGNYTQRVFPSSRKIKELLNSGALGKLRTISYVWGSEFTWATASGFYFNTKESPRGALLDRGTHAIDLICWWLGAPPRLVESRNDSAGGTEAVAHVQMEHEGCRIDVHISWLSKLSNQVTIEGEHGTITNGIDAWWKLPIAWHTGKRETLYFAQETDTHFGYSGPEVVDNFLDVIRGAANPLIPAADVLPSIDLIEEAYQRATRFNLPWQEEEMGELAL